MLAIYPKYLVSNTTNTLLLYDYDHDSDDLSGFTQIDFHLKVGGSVLKLSAKLLSDADVPDGFVRGYVCDQALERNTGKPVGLLVQVDVPYIAPSPVGCLIAILSHIPGLRFLFHSLTPPAPIGTGDGSGTVGNGTATISIQPTTLELF